MTEEEWNGMSEMDRLAFSIEHSEELIAFLEARLDAALLPEFTASDIAWLRDCRITMPIGDANDQS